MTRSDQELSKRDRQRLRRERRQEIERRQQAQASRKRVLAFGLVISVAVALVVLAVTQMQRNQPKPPEGVQTLAIASSEHVQGPVEYPQTPPVGGPHNPAWQDCKFYDAPVANVHAVHSLEHGAVWITYRPDLPADQVATLRTLAESESLVLVSPYEGLPTPVIASAWGRQLQLDSVNDPRLIQFVQFFQGGPQTPEPGARCDGGVAEPTGA